MTSFRAPTRPWIASITLLTVAAAAAIGLAAQMRVGGGLLPHAFCINASPTLLRLHLVSDSLIAFAYFLIPWALLYFTRRRPDLPFQWVSWVFGVFIIACGLTHVFHVWTLYYPVYWLSGMAKAVTAAASIATAWLLYRAMPLALAMPSAQQLRNANAALLAEVRARELAQIELQEAKLEVERLLSQEKSEALEALADANRKVREESAQFQVLADNIAQLAWMTDATGSIYWYNRRWFDYTGSDLQQMRGWGWKAVHHPDHVERVVEKFTSHIASGQAWEDTFPLLGADGEFRWFLSRAFPLRDADGKIVRWFGTNTDINEQVLAQQELREADKRKDDFIAVLAHELRNPLAPVRNAAEIISRLHQGDAKSRQAIGIMLRQISHMTRLVDDLLDVARINDGRLEIRRQACDLGQIVNSVCHDYASTLLAAHNDMAVHSEGQLPVFADPVRIAQAIGNLLQNASRFAAGARVEVSVRAEGSEAVVRVRDFGGGIASDLLPRLFEPFSQGPQEISRSRGGLGLGLALTRGIAVLHGGRVIAANHEDGGLCSQCLYRCRGDVDRRWQREARRRTGCRIENPGVFVQSPALKSNPRRFRPVAPRSLAQSV